MLAYVHFPRWITPTIFGFLNEPQLQVLSVILKIAGFAGFLIALFFTIKKEVKLVSEQKSKTKRKKKAEASIVMRTLPGILYFLCGFAALTLVTGGITALLALPLIMRIVTACIIVAIPGFFVYQFVTKKYSAEAAAASFEFASFLLFTATGAYLALALFFDFTILLNYMRWYGMMYIVAISLAYAQTVILMKIDTFKTIKKEDIDDFYFWGVLGLILGARLGSCLIYNFSYYITHPLEILIPFSNGQFTGFQGMSYHGGVIGVTLAMFIFIYKRKLDLREVSAVICTSIPFGYTFGRLANFINGELYGRVTASPMGMFFPGAHSVPLGLESTQKIMKQLDWKVVGNKVIEKGGTIIENVLYPVYGSNIPGINLPRHASQLYEAFFEGIVLGILVWTAGRKFKPFKGFEAPLYLAGYAFFRFLIEYFRQPDADFADVKSGKYTGFIFSNISMGQILCFLMILGAVLLGAWFYKQSLDEKKLKKT